VGGWVGRKGNSGGRRGWVERGSWGETAFESSDWGTRRKLPSLSTLFTNQLFIDIYADCFDMATLTKMLKHCHKIARFNRKPFLNKVGINNKLFLKMEERSQYIPIKFKILS
jgi:hypothetical protein